MRFASCILTIIFSIATVALGQSPTCTKCSSAYIPKSEVDTYIKNAIATKTIDQQIRAVDAGKANVDVGVVYRGKLTGNPNAAEHDFVSEVYHVIDGSATLLTGWDIVGYQKREAANNAVANLNGPGGDGTGIRNGTVNELKAGDVIVIPAGVGHQFIKIDDHITYLMIRVDPDKVTPLK